jgi:hypothetical protein
MLALRVSTQTSTAYHTGLEGEASSTVNFLGAWSCLMLSALLLLAGGFDTVSMPTMRARRSMESNGGVKHSLGDLKAVDAAGRGMSARVVPAHTMGGAADPIWPSEEGDCGEQPLPDEHFWPPRSLWMTFATWNPAEV